MQRQLSYVQAVNFRLGTFESHDQAARPSESPWYVRGPAAEPGSKEPMVARLHEIGCRLACVQPHCSVRPGKPGLVRRCLSGHGPAEKSRAESLQKAAHARARCALINGDFRITFKTESAGDVENAPFQGNHQREKWFGKNCAIEIHYGQSFCKSYAKNLFPAGAQGIFVQNLLSGFSPHIWAVSLTEPSYARWSARAHEALRLLV